MTDPVDQLFALDQLLAVLERRLNYEAFDYDAAVPALSTAITNCEERLSEDERQRLASIRDQHSFYKSEPRPHWPGRHTGEES